MENLIFYIHLASLTAAVAGILMADTEAFQWLRGTRKVVSRHATFTAHWIVSVGLSGLILSGLYMFWPMRDYLLNQPLFLLKITFVVALLINSFFIDYLMPTAEKRSYASLQLGEKMPFLVSGGVSTLSWLGAAISALILFN